MKSIAIYEGSMDPPTNGHLWMIEQGSKMFDQLIVAIGINPDKTYTFDIEKRFEWLEEIIEPLAAKYGTELVTINNEFLVDFAKESGASYILRGIRNEKDFLYERSMRNINSDIEPDIQSVFLMPPRNICEISSSLVKGMVGPRGWEKVVSQYVPNCVLQSFRDNDH